MQRFLIIFTLLLLPFTYVNSLAQTVTIGTEDYLGSEIYGALPINPFFGFTYSQSIYLAEDIDATGMITAIKYHFNGTSLANSRVLKIYIGHTNKTAFSGRLDWFNASELTLVFDGTVDSVRGDTWLRIPLTTPFAYNGLDNLVIGVDENEPGYDSPTDKFYFSTIPANLGYRSLVYTDDTDNPDPEGVLPWGEVFPYYANIQVEGLAMNCKPPSTPSVFDITNSMATAAWSTPIGPTVNNYTWKVVSSGNSVNATAVAMGTTTDTTVGVTGLMSGITYDFYVRTTCTDHNIFRWSKPVSFTIGCPPITNFPIGEDFETPIGQNLPLCWTQVDSISNGRYWHSEAGSGQSNGRGLVLTGHYADESLLVLPPMTLNGHQRLRYSMRASTDGELARYALKMSTTGKKTADFTIALTDTIAINHSAYQEKILDLSPYSGTVHIAIQIPLGDRQYQNELYLDDVFVENIPTCLEPTALVAMPIAHDTAVLTWVTVGTDSAGWAIYYGDSATVNAPYSNEILRGTTVSTIQSNRYVLPNLSQNKNYKWWIRRVCSVGDTSRWINGNDFKTPAACGTPVNLKLIADSTTARFHWTTNARPHSWTIYYGLFETTVSPFEPNPNGTFLTATDTSFILTNLEYPKLYKLWIRSNCDTIVGDSEWSTMWGFGTYVKNDFCSQALPIAVDSNYTTALTHPTPIYAGGEGLDEDLGGYLTNFKDVWYKFVAPSNDKRLMIRTTSLESDNSWYVALYDQCNGRALTYQAGNDINRQSLIELCPHEYTANATYYVRVFPRVVNQPYNNNLIIYSDTTFCPAVPRNDYAANATPLIGTDTLVGTTVLATIQSNAPPSCKPSDRDMYDVWYKFSSGSGANRMLNAHVVLENITRDKFLNMAIYKGDYTGLSEVNPTPLVSCGSTTSTVFKVDRLLKGMEENQDYYVRVWSEYVWEQGDFTLHLENILLRDSAYVDGYPTFVCKSVKPITIDSTNNNRWTPIMGNEDIMAEINANGQDLGTVQMDIYHYTDILRTYENSVYLGRNMFLKASKWPKTPIQMRFYIAASEWDSIKNIDPIFNDTTFRVVRMVGDSVCKTDVDPTGFALTRINKPQLSKVGQDYCLEYTTSSLGHFYVADIPRTTIAYPNARICPSETSQKDSLSGASGGTYTALPVGLSINATTGTVNPTTSTAGLYTVSYAIPDLYGGGVATTTIKIDTATQITVQPPTRRVLTVGLPIVLSVDGVGENLTYQWRKDSINIPNATTKTLTLPATSMADTGVYAVVLTGGCGSVTSLNTTISNDNGIIVSAKVFLQGAFNTSTGLMNDNLRTLNLLPTVEPYSNLAAFTQVKGNKNATVTPSVLAASDNTALVDWVFLELRDATDPSVIVATQSVLVRKDGVVVDAEGNAAIYFGDVSAGNYDVAIRHRNHFGIRTANALNFVKGVPTAFDFTTPTAAIYVNPSITSNPPTKTITVAGVDYRTLWTGDINQDGFIKYNGSKNDRSVILLKIGGVLTSTSSGYSLEDVNLNGLVKYNGSLNDRSVLLLNVGGVLTNVLKQHL